MKPVVHLPSLYSSPNAACGQVYSHEHVVYMPGGDPPTCAWCAVQVVRMERVYSKKLDAVVIKKLVERWRRILPEHEL